MSSGRIVLAVVAVAAVAFLAYHVLHRSSPLRAPRSLGSMALLQENPPEVRRARSSLSARGLHGVVVALYGFPGTPVTGGSNGFVLLAARTDHATADLRQAMTVASAVSGGLISPFSERLAGSDYTCGTIQGARGEATTCFWQGPHAVVMGIGYGIDGTTTITLTSSAKLHLGLAD